MSLNPTISLSAPTHRVASPHGDHGFETRPVTATLCAVVVDGLSALTKPSLSTLLKGVVGLTVLTGAFSSPLPTCNTTLQPHSFDLTVTDRFIVLKAPHSYLTAHHFIHGLPNQNAIVSFVEHNKGLQSLMATAGLDLSTAFTFEAIKAAAYRLYESKGRSVADAWDIMTKNESSSFSPALELFSGGYEVKPKQLRNILPTTSYNRPLSEALKDYLGFILVFQSVLKQHLDAAPQESYRFGRLYDVYNGSFLPAPSLRFVSAAESQAVFNPSYFRRCVSNNTLHLYLIHGKGVPIYDITDHNLRHITDLGTREVVFPLGTTFSFLRQSESQVIGLTLMKEIKDRDNHLDSSLVNVALENHATIPFLLKTDLRPDTNPVDTLRTGLQRADITRIKLVEVNATTPDLPPDNQTE